MPFPTHYPAEFSTVVWRFLRFVKGGRVFTGVSNEMDLPPKPFFPEVLSRAGAREKVRKYANPQQPANCVVRVYLKPKALRSLGWSEADIEREMEARLRRAFAKAYPEIDSPGAVCDCQTNPTSTGCSAFGCKVQ